MSIQTRGNIIECLVVHVEFNITIQHHTHSLIIIITTTLLLLQQIKKLKKNEYHL